MTSHTSRLWQGLARESEIRAPGGMRAAWDGARTSKCANESGGPWTVGLCGRGTATTVNSASNQE